MARQRTARKITHDLASIPDKLYFKIGEVSRIVGVEPYVLRYWETEFREVSPIKSRMKQRLYRRKDVEMLLKIRDLLYRQRFTIDGARKRLKAEGRETGDVDGVSQLGLGLASSDAERYPANIRKELASRLEGLLKDMRSVLKE